MSRETFRQSLWFALATPTYGSQALENDIETEVLIIGGGFLGLSTALHLAEAGIRTVLLEAEEIGFGASGRNTGFVVPSHKTALGPDDVRARLGETGERLNALVGGAGRLVFDLIARHGVECDAEPIGWLQPAHTAAIARLLDRRQAEWRARGKDVEILGEAETARRTGMKGYHGALFDPTGGQINPLAYARGLARAAVRAGVILHEKSPVTALQSTSRGWRAAASAGSVTAARVLLTTNALIGNLNEAVAASIVPVQVHQIATDVLPSVLRERILPGGTPVADTRRHTLAIRWSPDGRLVTGGLVVPGPAKLARAAQFFLRRLQKQFPQLGSSRAAYVWDGMIAVTMDDLPRFMQVAPGLDAAIGCNGRGIALTTSLGRAAAALYEGKLSEAEFPVPVTKPRPVVGRALAQRGPALWLKWSEFRDWLDTRAG